MSLTQLKIITYVTLLLIRLVFGDNGPVTRICSDYNECNQYDLNSGQLICRGASSCSFDCSPTCINTTIINSWSPRPNKGSIICSGSESCARSDFITSNSDFIKCLGAKSCNGGSSTFSGGNTSIMTARGIVCSGGESCTKDNSNSNSMQVIMTGRLGSDIICDGGDSCRGPGVIMDLEGTTSVECNAANSCKETTINVNRGTLLCRGVESCANADINTDGYTLCYGTRSCQGATVQVNTANRYFIGYGYRSGQNAEILGASPIRGFGYESLKDGIIDSVGLATMDIEMYGDSAGNGAKIICRSSAECSLICIGNACQNLEYECETGAICNITPKKCPTDNSRKKIAGVNCPTFITGTSKRTITINEYDETQNDNILSTETSSLLCGLEDECRGQSITQSGTTICGGYNSCDDTQISITGTSTNSSLLCSGDSSCSGATITSTTSVYCSGEYGCWRASISADDMIICDGSYGCRETDIDLGPDTIIKCSGSLGCSASSISRLKGSSAGSLQCDGFQSCRDSDITYTTDIECNGYYSCWGSSTKTLNGDLYCDGYYSCSVHNVTSGDLNKKNPSDRTTIYVGSGLGMYYGTVSAERIYGYGYQSLRRTIINSLGQGSITVEALGYESMIEATIICESGDICLLKCVSGACDSTTNYVCLDGAICNLNPKQCLTRSGGKFKGISCPTISTNITTNAQLDEIENIEDIDNGLDMELFGDIEFANNDHQYGDIMNVLLFVVVALLLVISVVMIYRKMRSNDKYLELK